MKRFRLEDYKDVNYVMYINTEEEYKIFVDFLHNNGTKNKEYFPYLKGLVNYYNREFDQFCFCFNDGIFGSSDFFKTYNYKILIFSDFDWSKEPKTIYVYQSKMIPHLFKCGNNEVKIYVLDTSLVGYEAYTEFDYSMIGEMIYNGGVEYGYIVGFDSILQYVVVNNNDDYDVYSFDDLLNFTNIYNKHFGREIKND